jgi:hypothetical protein
MQTVFLESHIREHLRMPKRAVFGIEDPHDMHRECKCTGNTKEFTEER